MLNKTKTVYIGGVKHILLPYKVIDSMFTEIAKNMDKDRLPGLEAMCLAIARRKSIKENNVLYFAITGKELHTLRNLLEFTI